MSQHTDPSPAVPGREPAEARQDDSGPLISRLLSRDPRYRGVVQKFTQRLNEQLQEMDEAWKRRDFEALAELAHWLKGSGGTVGLDAFTEPAIELEQLAEAANEGRIEGMLAELRQLAGRIRVPADDCELSSRGQVP